jgi:hypothetical protein
LPIHQHLVRRALAAAARVAHLPALTLAAAAAGVRARDARANTGLALRSDVAHLSECAARKAYVVLAAVGAIALHFALDAAATIPTAGRALLVAGLATADAGSVTVELGFAVVGYAASIVTGARLTRFESALSTGDALLAGRAEARILGRICAAADAAGNVAAFARRSAGLRATDAVDTR